MKITDHVTFHDKKLEARCARGPIPMSHLYEAYFDGDVDIAGDIDAFLRQRDLFVKYTLTSEHLRWAVTNFVPEVTIHSKKQDRRIVREHYDRGNDFFGWFLGERMVYTSGFFTHPGESLEQAQDNKIEPGLPQAQARAGRAPARHRLRLGHPRPSRRRALRRRRHRRHHLPSDRRSSATSASRARG